MEALFRSMRVIFQEGKIITMLQSLALFLTNLKTKTGLITLHMKDLNLIYWLLAISLKHSKQIFVVFPEQLLSAL